MRSLAGSSSAARPRRSARRRGSRVPLLDLGAAIAIGLSYFTIIYLTGLGGLFSERSGIVNIGLEGLMITGTVMGAWGAINWGPVAGLAIGAISGLLFSLVHAVATVTFRVDHIVSGVVINVVALGLARFLPPIFFVLNRTRFGLRLRSAGENPEATRTLGVRVAPLRYSGVALSGLLAGLSGAFLAIEVNALYQEGQTQGLGFIALASLILGNWSPSRLMVGALLFGFAQAVPLRLDDAPVIGALPDQFVRMIPYIVTIVAIAGFVGRVQPPAAAGKAYEGAGGT